jgi:hypothetical protein
MCKNVAKLEMYAKGRRGSKSGKMGVGAGKFRNKTSEVAVERAPGAGQLDARE